MDRKQPRPARQHQHQQVFRYIELRCLWEERLTAGHLQQLFSISRDSASKRINEYIALCPGNLRYDASLKGYFPTDTFAPEYSQGSLEEYIHDFIGADMQGIPAYNSVSCFPMQSFERRPDPEIVRPILQAISQNNRIDIAYTSVTNPDNDGRIISPHSLIHDGARWHVRAWCEKNQGFRDFVVSRIREVWGKEGASEKSRSDDRLWETILTLTIQPDVRLTPAQQEVIALEYGMQKNENGIYQRSYPVRAALLLYTLNHLRLDRLKENAEAQQIMLTQECQREITPYLPRA
ncbi:MAG: hypothetical protein CMI00_05515 [Oceanospirillaceae bacterium]|nr:hypothetical protein [Oceanospirillaceae bacterium]|tara:strand:+ start:185 stop:1060 length:876 start_codon:yes stop_codon:yes gene_type:complete